MQSWTNVLRMKNKLSKILNVKNVVENKHNVENMKILLKMCAMRKNTRKNIHNLKNVHKVKNTRKIIHNMKNIRKKYAQCGNCIWEYKQLKKLDDFEGFLRFPS